MSRTPALPKIGAIDWLVSEVRIHHRDDGYVSVTAGTHADFPGLAVHQSLSSPKLLAITHLASGHAVIQGIRRADAALFLPELLADLAAAGDWTLSAAAIHADVPTRTRMQSAIEAGYGLIGHSVELNRANGVTVSAREATP
jgi:hypothetical protein